jgi:hypothetical protein
MLDKAPMMTMITETTAPPHAIVHATLVIHRKTAHSGRKSMAKSSRSVRVRAMTRTVTRLSWQGPSRAICGKKGVIHIVATTS